MSVLTLHLHDLNKPIELWVCLQDVCKVGGVGGLHKECGGFLDELLVSQKPIGKELNQINAQALVPEDRTAAERRRRPISTRLAVFQKYGSVVNYGV